MSNGWISWVFLRKSFETSSPLRWCSSLRSVFIVWLDLFPFTKIDDFEFSTILASLFSSIFLPLWVLAFLIRLSVFPARFNYPVTVFYLPFFFGAICLTIFNSLFINLIYIKILISKINHKGLISLLTTSYNY